jgi:geranylgeranyl pyrophosphate synthase
MKTMFDSFQQYCQYRRPMLCSALEECIPDLLSCIPVREYRDFHLALNGGKKIRGVLLGMIAEVLGGRWEAALPRAVAVELIHIASLIHDDFVDQDRIRRHMPAVWTLEGARRAVLLGDVIFASAIRMMSEMGRDDGRVVSRAIAEISRGALMEFSDPVKLLEQMGSHSGSGDLYEKIIHLKTGILFEAACELGAIAAETDDGTRRRCMRYGALIGEAYQIADDIKDLQECLMEGSIRSDKIPLLAPALLCFAEDDARAHMEPLLMGGASQVHQPLRQCLRSAIQGMEEEIQRRLHQAIDEMRETLEETPHSMLGFKAPADLVAMFTLS